MCLFGVLQPEHPYSLQGKITPKKNPSKDDLHTTCHAKIWYESHHPPQH